MSLCFASEILCSGRYHRVAFRRSGSRGLPSHAAHPVWHHDCGPGPLSEEVPAGKVCFPGGAGVWDTLLDVLHPSWCHREVFKIYYIVNLGPICINWICEHSMLPLMCHSLLLLHRRFNRNPVAQLWYFVKCIYFGLSAYQIKCGYPNRILGNFLTKNYNYINLFLFQG